MEEEIKKITGSLDFSLEQNNKLLEENKEHKGDKASLTEKIK